MEPINWLLIVIAVLLLVLIPFTPKLVRLRIRFARWIHFDRAADLLENHFQGWVLFFRIIFVVVAALMFYSGWTHSA